MPEEKKTVKTTETTTTTRVVPPTDVVIEPVEVVEVETTGPSMFSRVIALIAMLLVVIVVIWGLIYLAELIGPWLSSLFNTKPSSALEVQAPATAISGDPIQVGWKYTTSAKGSYAFIYPCTTSFQFGTAGTNGQMNIVPCGAPFSAANNPITVIPLLSGTTTIQEPISILFLASGTSQIEAQGTANVTINAGAPVAQQATPPVTTTPVTTTKSAPVASGPADLSVRIISASVDGYGNGIVTFDIANVGGSATGTYFFTAYLPTQSGYTYNSPAQVSLAPGSHVVSTLHFSQAVGGTVNIIVDPSNSIKESNKGNNYASQTLTAPYYNY